MKLKKIIIPAAAVMAFYGCAAVGVDYVSPKTDMPSAWHTQLKGGKTADDEAVLNRWWAVFGDETLNSLADMAVKNNLDLKSAYYAVTSAKAKLKMTEADKLPTFSATGSATGYHYGDKSLKDRNVDSYAAGLDAAWEIDVFGGVKRSIEVSSAELGSYQEAMRDVMVSLLAETAQNYINVRAYQDRIKLAEEDVRIKQELYEIALRKYQTGVSDASDTQQAEYNLEYAKTTVHTYNIGLEEAYNRLAVLTGQKPGALHDMLSKKGILPSIPKSVVTGIPADIIRRRPDIREAERNLAAQTARIGVAEADKYPTFTLGGSIGYQAGSIGSLFNTSNSTLSIGPSFKWAVFDLGAIKQNVSAQTETQKQYLAKYEQAVLTAMEDVENAMTSYDQESSKNAQLKKAYDSASAAYDLARKKYQAGVSDYTDVATAEAAYINYHDQLIQSTANADVYVVSLYKALGGGWNTAEGQGNK